MKMMLLATASIMGLMTVGAVAGQPDNPGGFGRDRAAAIQNFRADDTAPGASEWGHIASERAGDNGQINRDYRETHGQTPYRGNDADDEIADDDSETLY